MTTRSYAFFALLLAAVVFIAAFRIHHENKPLPPAEPDNSSEVSSFSYVEPNLYVGGRTRKPPPGTTAVLSLSYNEDVYQVPNHRYSPIPDGGHAPSLDWLKQQVAFVDSQVKAGHQTYIHCDAGMSRGPFVTTAYLMYEHHWPRDEALRFLQEKRPIIEPNIYFMDLLLDWQDDLNGKPKPAATAPANSY